MLSGLTSQLGGLIKGNKANEGQVVEEVKSPEEMAKTSRSGSQGDGGGMLQNVKASLPSWLGGDKAAVETTETINVEGEETTGTNEEEKNVDKVKNLGSLLFSTIKGAGQKIKDTNLLTDFQHQQELFLQKARGSISSANPPWVGHLKEKELKEEVLGLSQDRRNFVRSPPPGVSFTWEYDEMLPVAKALLKEDPNLEKMRYELVPKIVSEENFWRNYFYRVELLKESLGEVKKQDSIDTDEEAEGPDAELERELDEFEVVNKSEPSNQELDSLLN